jgi:UDP-N-acetylglucosamine 2-epimerase (non-hydrolysing)
MLDIEMQAFGIEPDIDLDLMTPGQEVHHLYARVLGTVTAVLRDVRPDFMLVQGDTTTAVASTMAAFYERVPVGHVEAGLRTRDLANPFPEEMNRRVISIMATLHFAPTTRARDFLLAEGVADGAVFVTGNTVIDSLLEVAREVQAPLRTERRHILVTAHRRESFGAPFEAICSAVRMLALRNPLVDFTYPVHPNPHVRGQAHRLLSGLDNVRLVDPLPYREFVRAMLGSYVILTDSGGVQEEAPSLCKPVLVLRDTTERPEAVEAGLARLVGTKPERIVSECERLLNDEAAYQAMQANANPFGDGRAGNRIVDALSGWFGLDAASTDDIAIAANGI